MPGMMMPGMMASSPQTIEFETNQLKKSDFPVLAMLVCDSSYAIDVCVPI